MWVWNVARIGLVSLSALGGAEYLRRRALEPAEESEAPASSVAPHLPAFDGSGRVPVACAPRPVPEPEPTHPVANDAPTADAAPPHAAPPLGPVAVHWGNGPAMLASAETGSFFSGRKRFEHEWSEGDGLGAPGFNARSCAMCHRDPVLGGAGGVEFNVIQSGDAIGYEPPEEGGDQLALMREVRAETLESLATLRTSITEGAFDHPDLPREFLEASLARCEEIATGVQTPSLLGAGLIDAIPDREILSREDPADRDGDGVTGVAVRIEVRGKREIGRFGWKANVPHLADFVRQALGGENGITAPDADRGFGLRDDKDAAADPEISQQGVDELVHFVAHLAPPERGGADVAHGEQLFERVGCAACHVPTLQTEDGRAVHLYSDLLLHELREPLELPIAFAVEVADLDLSTELRTPPLWGVSDTAPYLQSGRAKTLTDAIRAHGAEGERARDSFERLDEYDQHALLAFLEDL